MDEARHALVARGFDQVERARDVARFERSGVGRIDHAGDVDHRAGAAYQPVERGAARQIARNPFDPQPWDLPLACQCPHFQPLCRRRLEQRLPDEPGRPGNRNQPFINGLGPNQSSTS